MRARIMILLLVLTTGLTATQLTEDDIGRVFYRYVEALRMGEYQTASQFWALYDRTITDQLKIQYQDCPVKLELGSPLWDNLDGMRASTVSVRVKKVDINRGYAKITYLVIAKDTTVGVHYMDIESNVDPYLVSPLQVFGENWDHIAGRYLEVIYRDPSLLEQRSIDVVDDYVWTTAKLLGLSNEKLVILESLRARTYLCQSFGEIEQLSGNWPFGAFYQPADAVVSRFLPDRNQIAQLLVSYAIDSLPACTLPLFQYGTATFLGGQNGRSRQVALSLGKYIYLNSFTKLQDLMTVAGFDALENNPDFSYPVAGLFCNYLFEQLGHDAYLDLYRNLSGTKAQIDAITSSGCESRVSRALGLDWSQVDSGFGEWVNAARFDEIQPGAEEDGELVYQSGFPGVLVRIVEDENYYNFIVNADSSNFAAAIITSQRSASSPYESFLFYEQFPSDEYDNEHFGVLISQNEVGCYDYFTNEITAKYIVGLTDDRPLSTAQPGEYRFRIDKGILGQLSDQSITIRSAR